MEYVFNMTYTTVLQGQVWQATARYFRMNVHICEGPCIHGNTNTNAHMYRDTTLLIAT